VKLVIQIPCFNEADNLPHTVAALPRQLDGIDSIEYLVIDDGSTDATVAVARKIGVQHIVQLTAHSGLAAGFAAGLEAALLQGADIIVNTDAEGRLILADALAYGIAKYAPECVIDLATLTGAVIVALGHHYTGVLGNDDNLIERLIAAGKKAGEPLWRLPLGADYSKQIESDVADMKNAGGKSAGTITAAAYLEKFVKNVPWAHLDIAGTAWEFTEKSYIPKGPSGTGVRTLIELVRSWGK